VAATPTVIAQWDLAGSGQQANLLSIALDTSYPTGGYAIDIGGNTALNQLVVCGEKGGYDWDWDAANQKLKAYSTAATEVANTTNLQASGPIIAIGIGK
jgi:hypothetical protein